MRWGANVGGTKEFTGNIFSEFDNDVSVKNTDLKSFRKK